MVFFKNLFFENLNKNVFLKKTSKLSE
jgi:hypothetical protein